MALYLALKSRKSLLHPSVSVGLAARPLRVRSTLRIQPGLARTTFAVPRYSCLSLSTLSLDTNACLHEYSVCSSPPPQPLAFSMALSREERRFFNRVAQRIQKWISRIYEFLCVSVRSAEVAIRLSPLCILTPAAVLSSRLWNDEKVSNVAWWYTLHALQGLGPAFVKLAQWAATRRDLFPPNICNRLSKLHDKGYTHSWSHSQETLTQAFGDYHDKGLTIYENDIIGCGSAAQVYSGTLTTTTNNGKEEATTRSVAIKILHPRFQHYVNRDLTFFKSIADLINALPIEKLRMLNLPRVVDNFGVILKRQADLRVEADNLTQFRDNFNNNDKQKQSGYIGMISFPSPVHGWIDENVLVEELVMDAQPIAEYLQDSSEAGWANAKRAGGSTLASLSENGIY